MVDEVFVPWQDQRAGVTFGCTKSGAGWLLPCRLAFTYPLVNNGGFHHRIWNEKRALRNVDEGQGAGRRGELAVNSDGERRSR